MSNNLAVLTGDIPAAHEHMTAAGYGELATTTVCITPGVCTDQRAEGAGGSDELTGSRAKRRRRATRDGSRRSCWHPGMRNDVRPLVSIAKLPLNGKQSSVNIKKKKLEDRR